MRQGRGAQRNNKKCCNRRVVPGLNLPSTLDDPSATWKQAGGGGGPNSGPSPSEPPPGFPQQVGNSGPPPGQPPPNQPFGPSPGGFPSGPFPPNNSGPGFSPGGNSGPYSAGPPPGAGTPTCPPQYTPSPAPSGSSTPGPGSGPGQFGGGPPPGSSGFPGGGPPNAGGPLYNGPGSFPPNAGFVGRPGSSGPPYAPGPPQGGPHPGHFPSPGQPFSGGPPSFGMPPGSPFGHPPGHPMPHGPPVHGMMPGQMGPGGPMDRMDQGPLPVPRRHTPYFGQPDYRVYELNKRLQQRTEESDNLWWDAFATEFFEDDATLTLTFCLEDGPKRYTIGRTLIPRYFRSIFDGGVTELYYSLRNPKESFHNTSITLDCDQCSMVTHHGKPLFTKVCTEGRLILEFTFDDLMRIKSWHLAVRTHRELIPRSVVAMHAQQDPGMLDQLSKNITRQGITNATLNYLRLCVILEPMQELMSRHKAYALTPRDCLKTTLFQKWQRMVAPPVVPAESQRPANKRRKRKGSTSGAGANSAPPAPNKKRSPGPNFSLASQDVMVVGEPSLMGGEFGDEDERLITRLENTQYDAANSLDDNNFSDSPLPGGPNSWGGGGPGGPVPGGPDSRGQPPGPGNTPSSQDSEKKSPAVSQ
ncbi:LIM domain-binding protein 2 isoform X3 [Neocloeon triangulifer]|uniref:LIM domain-binding protein 2 isoform X3 n=1 Tax=Neocloeon triangulifer TaxID=2078957 RepID=UPI00286F1CBF|nr:LIM domain-binding protein 2 isoform X3 [Neocloeon triangulifer]